MLFLCAEEECRRKWHACLAVLGKMQLNTSVWYTCFGELVRSAVAHSCLAYLFFWLCQEILGLHMAAWRAHFAMLWHATNSVVACRCLTRLPGYNDSQWCWIWLPAGLFDRARQPCPAAGPRIQPHALICGLLVPAKAGLP